MAFLDGLAVTRSNAAARLPQTPGIRVLYRLGTGGVVRVAVATIFVAQVAFFITALRPELADQTVIGRDASNYFAAGQRLNDGHSLYQLSPGDRPVPLLPPPHAQVPILSPPLLAVVWRPLALLGDPAMVAWGLAGVIALGTATLVMIARGGFRRLAIIAPIGLFIAESMWSGNVNPFIVLLVIGVWVASARGHSATAGALVALAAGLKLTPIYLAWWFVVRRDWRALGGLVAAGAALGVVSLLGAGLDNHLAFLKVAGVTAVDGASPWSVAGFIRNWGLPAEIAAASTLGWTLLSGATVWLLRKRPGASFAAAVLMVLYSSPVVMLGNLALLLATTIPYHRDRAALAPRPAAATEGALLAPPEPAS